MAAAASVPSTGFVDDIDPDESASNVSGATNSSTMYVRHSRRQAAFAAKQKIRKQQQLQLERSIAEIENEELLTSIEHQRQEMLLEMARKKKEQEMEMDCQRKEHELQVAREKAELSIRRKRMELSMRELSAAADSDAEEEEIESILNNKQSQVSKRKNLIESDLSGSYHDASNVLNNVEESVGSTEDAEETVREEPSAVLNARVTSITGLPVPLASQALPATNSNVAAPGGRPNIAQQQLLSRPVTIITNPTTTLISLDALLQRRSLLLLKQRSLTI